MAELPHRPTAVPSHLRESTSAAAPKSTKSQTRRDVKEREDAFASIQSSMSRHRTPVTFDEEGINSSNGRRAEASIALADQSSPKEKKTQIAASYTPPDSTSRSASPILKAHTVDFDGLSWPSKQKNLA